MPVSYSVKLPLFIFLNFFFASALLLFFFEREREMIPEVSKEDHSIDNQSAQGCIKVFINQKWYQVCFLIPKIF